MTSAEATYLFRHAVLRDAAYELQTLSARTRLHQHAAEAMVVVVPADRLDTHASEIARHCRVAQEQASDQRMRTLEREYTLRAAGAALRACNAELALALWSRMSDICETVERAEYLRRAGDAALDAGQPSKAESLLTRALECDCPDAVRVKALGDLARLRAETDQHEQAEADFAEALHLAQALGDNVLECTLQGNLAGLYARSGRNEQSEQLLRTILRERIQFVERRNEGVWRGNLANLLYAREALAEAQPLFEQALAIARDEGDLSHESLWLGNLGMLHRRAGRPAQGIELLVRAVDLVRQTGNRRYEGVLLGYLAGAYAQQKQYEVSSELYARAVAIHREVGNRRFECMHGADLAADLLRTGRVNDAATVWRRAVELMRQHEQAALERRSAAIRAICHELGIAPLEP